MSTGSSFKNLEKILSRELPRTALKVFNIFHKNLVQERVLALSAIFVIFKVFGVRGGKITL